MIRAEVGKTPHEQSVDQDTKSMNVTSSICSVRRSPLFGGHVDFGPDRESGQVDANSGGLRAAKIGDLERTLLVNENVCRLDVPMYHTLGVNELKSVVDFSGGPDLGLDLHWTTDQLFQRSVEQLQQEERILFQRLLMKLYYLDDVRVPLQVQQESSLLQKPVDHLGRTAKRREDALQGTDEAIDPPTNTPDHATSAFADETKIVVPDHFLGHG
jgi:hypothetical protein